MDAFLEIIGDFGLYQKRNFIFLSLPTIVVAMQKLAWVFLGAKVNHRCKLPWEGSNASYYLSSTEMSLYFPRDEDTDSGYSQCQMYSDTDELTAVNSSERILHYDSEKLTTCSEFIYDTSKYKTSAVIDYNLVCDRAWMRATVQSCFMIGMLCGSYIFGDLSDRIGRKPVFLSAIFLMLVTGIIQTTVADYYFFTFARFILGASLQGIFLIAYVIIMEMVGKRRRVMVGILAHGFYSIAYFIGAGIAFAITSWKWLQVAYTLPAVLFIPYLWTVHESARWLCTKGRLPEARVILKKVAEVNGKTVSDDVLEKALTITPGESQGNSLDLFRYKSLRKKTFIVFFCWMVNSGVYYGLSLNTSNLGGNDYLNFAISGAVEIPGLLFAVYIVDKVGRRLPLCGLMVAGGTALLIGIFLQKGSLALIILAMVGKMCITSSYAIIYVFTTESFPTVVRNVAVGSSSTVARVGGALAPYINLLGDFWMPLPFIIFGGVSFTSGLLCLFLEETKDRPMTDLIEEKIKLTTELPDTKDGEPAI